MWGVWGRALYHPRPLVRPGVRPGPAAHWLWVREMGAWGPVTNSTARASASWLCALWGRHEGARGGRLLPGCGASVVGVHEHPKAWHPDRPTTSRAPEKSPDPLHPEPIYGALDRTAELLAKLLSGSEDRDVTALSEAVKAKLGITEPLPKPALLSPLHRWSTLADDLKRSRVSRLLPKVTCPSPFHPRSRTVPWDWETSRHGVVNHGPTMRNLATGSRENALNSGTAVRCPQG